MKPTYLSLASGVGGIDLGLDRAGFRCVGQVEIDPYCQKILAQHWPEVPRHDDIRTTVEWWADRPAPDLVAAGFPCQPVSRGGKRQAQADERWLWPAVARVIRHLRPRFALLENVAGLLDRGMGDVLGDLADCGYDAEWQVIRASDVGAPHSRERVVIVAYPEGVYGLSRGVLVESRDGQAPKPVGGLPGLAEDQRRAAAVQWLEREPRVDRLAHGVPAQVDRLRVAGNSVVPQLAEHVGGLLMVALMSHDPTATDRDFEMCPHGDPTCPCPDGLVCHYVDDPISETFALSPSSPVGLGQDKEAAKEEAVDEIAVMEARLGYELNDWQREVVRHVLNGGEVTLNVPHRSGATAFHSAISAALAGGTE